MCITWILQQRDPIPGEESEAAESDEEELIASGSMLDEDEDALRQEYITQGVIMDEDEDDGIEYEAWGGIQEDVPEEEEEATMEEVEEAEPVEEQAEAGPSTTTAAAAPTLTKKEKAKALRDAAAAKKAAAEQAEVEAEPAAPVDESFDGQYLASNACSGVLSVS